MPKIQWTRLPPALRDHLFERLRERKITTEDLYRLKELIAPVHIAEAIQYRRFDRG